jgi:hypothetical protein
MRFIKSLLKISFLNWSISTIMIELIFLAVYIQSCHMGCSSAVYAQWMARAYFDVSFSSWTLEYVYSPA